MSIKLNEPVDNSDEITVRDVILSVKEYGLYFIRYWYVFVILGLVGGVIGYTSVAKQKFTYTADLTFVVEDGKSGGSGALAGYAGFASQLGMDVGSSNSTGLFQGDNIIEFLKSRLMVEKALLSPYPGDSTKSLADIYVELTDIENGSDPKTNTEKITFAPHSENSGRTKDSLLNGMYHSIVSKKLNIERTDKKMSFLKASFTSIDERFSKAFVESLVNEATLFYVATKTKRSKENVDNLQKKADSLLNLMNRKSYDAAITQDLNLNPARRIATVGVELSNRDKGITLTMFSEVIKNLEVAKSVLAQDMPIIQIIDSPVLPLPKERKSKLVSALTWAIGLGLIAFVVLGIRKYFKGLGL